MQRKEKISNNNDISNSKEVILYNLINNLKSNFSSDQILELITGKVEDKKNLIPVDVFKNRKLSVLELTVKFLKENKNLKFSEIAKLINRDNRTIWSSYNNSLKKYKGKLENKSRIYVPISIFADRKLSPLEALVNCLKSSFKMKLHQIAFALSRDERTIWTIANRINEKRK